MRNKFVIYSVIVGGYDEVKQPVVIDDRFDYVLFSDNIDVWQIGVWQVKRIPYNDDDLLRLSRYPKLMPNKVLPEYEASLYIDGTLQIASDYIYDRFFELIRSNVEWGGIKHYYRDCIYDEICGIVTFPDKATHDYECIKWFMKLKKEGFPSHFGLYENNVIFRLHNDNVAMIGELWWQTLETLCRRDQFSLMYLFWKYPMSRDYFLIPEEDAKHTNHFIYNKHSNSRKNTVLNFNEKLRRICWSRSPYREKWYGYVLEHVCWFPISWLALPLWEVYALIRYAIPDKTKEIVRRTFA